MSAAAYSGLVAPNYISDLIGSPCCCGSRGGLGQVDFCEEHHRYWYNGERVPSVTQLLAGLDNFAGVDPEVLEAARIRGIAVHAATQLDDEGDLDMTTVDDIVRPYLYAWRQFRSDTGFTPYPGGQERIVYHQKYRYAGRLDVIGEMGGKRVLIDKKSGEQVPLSAGPQTAAYMEAENVERRPVDYIRARYVVQLRATGEYSLVRYKDDRGDLGCFLSHLNIYQWRQRNG